LACLKRSGEHCRRRLGAAPRLRCGPGVLRHRCAIVEEVGSGPQKRSREPS
jgi:hypothetical protein